MYFLYFGGTKKAAPTKANKIRKAVFILHCSGFGYIPYINLLNQTLTKTQQAPSLVQSSLVDPIKSASKNSQSNNGGVYFFAHESHMVKGELFDLCRLHRSPRCFGIRGDKVLDVFTGADSLQG